MFSVNVYVAHISIYKYWLNHINTCFQLPSKVANLDKAPIAAREKKKWSEKLVFLDCAICTELLL